MPARSLTSALLNCKCPRCREGNIFRGPLTQFSHWGVTNPLCPECKANFEPEPGFYFGAMFISYAFSVAWGVAIWVALHVLAKPSDNVYILSISIGVTLMAPISFIYSRVLWLYWFGGIRRLP